MRVSNLVVSTAVVSILRGLVVKGFWSEVPVTYGYSMEKDSQWRKSCGRRDSSCASCHCCSSSCPIFLYAYSRADNKCCREDGAAHACLHHRHLSGRVVGAGLTGLVAVLMERQRTGVFAWTFERDYITPMDLRLGFPLVVLSMVCVFLYFAGALVRGKQTVGDYILNIRTFNRDGDAKFGFGEACRRVIVGMRAVSPFAWFRGIGINGRASYEEGMLTRVVVVRSSPYTL